MISLARPPGRPAISSAGKRLGYPFSFGRPAGGGVHTTQYVLSHIMMVHPMHSDGAVVPCKLPPPHLDVVCDLRMRGLSMQNLIPRVLGLGQNNGPKGARRGRIAGSAAANT